MGIGFRPVQEGASVFLAGLCSAQKKLKNCPPEGCVDTTRICSEFLRGFSGGGGFRFIFLLIITFTFQPNSVGGFTLSDLLDKPWSRVSSLLPPGTCLRLLSRIGFGIPTARRFSSSVAIVTNSRSRAFRLSIFIQENLPSSMHSVRHEPTKLIFSLPSRRGLSHLLYI